MERLFSPGHGCPVVAYGQPLAAPRWQGAGGEPKLLKNTEGLIKAAYTVSDALGKEVEEIANEGPNPERLKRLRKFVNESFGEHAELVYEAIVRGLSPPE